MGVSDLAIEAAMKAEAEGETEEAAGEEATHGEL